MKIKIEKLLSLPAVKTGQNASGKYMIAAAWAAGWVEGMRVEEMLVRAWNGTVKNLVAGAELDTKKDAVDAWWVVQDNRLPARPRGGLQ